MTGAIPPAAKRRHATRERPPGCTVLHSGSGHVRSRPQPTFDRLALSVHPRRKRGHAFLADDRSHLIVVQRSWWYRAEYRLIPDDHGCHIEHVVLGVGGRGGRVALVLGRKRIAAAPAAFEALVRRLRIELE